MKSPLSLVVAAFLLGALAHVEAQDGEETETARLDPDLLPGGLTEDELETFADIYVDLEKISAKYEKELGSVQSEEEASQLQARMQREAHEAIERHGWTEEKYEAVNETVNSSSELLERALALIEERT